MSIKTLDSHVISGLGGQVGNFTVGTGRVVLSIQQDTENPSIVKLQLHVSAFCNNMTSSTRTVPSGVISASVFNIKKDGTSTSASGYASTSSKSCAGYGGVSVSADDDVIIDISRRADSNITYTGKISATCAGTTAPDENFTLVVPQLRRVSNSGNRILFTSGNDSYELRI